MEIFTNRCKLMKLNTGNAKTMKAHLAWQWAA